MSPAQPAAASKPQSQQTIHIYTITRHTIITNKIKSLTGHQQTTTSTEYGSPSGQWQRKFDRGLTQLIHADLHWLDVPEPVKYKSVKPLQRYRNFCDFQNGGCRHLEFPKIHQFPKVHLHDDVPMPGRQYLTAYWTPVSETAS